MTKDEVVVSGHGVEEVYETEDVAPVVDPVVRRGGPAPQADAELESAAVDVAAARLQFAQKDASGAAPPLSGDLRRDYERAVAWVAQLRDRAAMVADAALPLPAERMVEASAVDDVLADLAGMLEDRRLGFALGADPGAALVVPERAAASTGDATAPVAVVSAEMERAAALEARLARLEARVGSTSGLPPSQPLQQVVSDLEQRVSLLREQDVGRLTRAHQAYVEEMRGGAADAGGGSVDRVLEVMGRWDEVAQQIPSLVDRLRALHAAHVGRALCREQADALQQQQAALQARLAEQQELLQTVQASVAESMATMQRNVDALMGSDKAGM